MGAEMFWRDRQFTQTENSYRFTKVIIIYLLYVCYILIIIIFYKNNMKITKTWIFDILWPRFEHYVLPY